VVIPVYFVVNNDLLLHVVITCCCYCIYCFMLFRVASGKNTFLLCWFVVPPNGHIGESHARVVVVRYPVVPPLLPVVPPLLPVVPLLLLVVPLLLLVVPPLLSVVTRPSPSSLAVSPPFVHSRQRVLYTSFLLTSPVDASMSLVPCSIIYVVPVVSCQSKPLLYSPFLLIVVFSGHLCKQFYINRCLLIILVVLCK